MVAVEQDRIMLSVRNAGATDSRVDGPRSWDREVARYWRRRQRHPPTGSATNHVLGTAYTLNV